MVAHDFLILTTVDEHHNAFLGVTGEPDGTACETMKRRFYRHARNPCPSAKFSVAAYRFGHSQARDRYSINRSFERRLVDAAGDNSRGSAPAPGLTSPTSR
ncbi:hypothetical protein [Arthrobacter zhaoguopingii]|uniref:hypothetical protein n=1 Tax=Arthrobacter zhaoguopingii TaxID=2681491 RepID=UPI0013587714|nr:hypothetical protein [Arthrobacter zhaoguopingii]